VSVRLSGERSGFGVRREGRRYFSVQALKIFGEKYSRDDMGQRKGAFFLRP